MAGDGSPGGIGDPAVHKKAAILYIVEKTCDFNRLANAPGHPALTA